MARAKDPITGLIPQLTPKKAFFVQEYLVDLNGTQAAIRAGYSPRTAAVQAAELLRKPNIQLAIQEAFAVRAQRVSISQDKVLQEIARVAFAHMGQFATWTKEGLTLVASEELTLDQMAAVVEVSESRTQQGTQVKVKLHDKLRALELAARHLGMLEQPVTAAPVQSVQITRVTVVLPPGYGPLAGVVEGGVRQAGEEGRAVV